MAVTSLVYGRRLTTDSLLRALEACDTVPVCIPSASPILLLLCYWGSVQYGNLLQYWFGLEILFLNLCTIRRNEIRRYYSIASLQYHGTKRRPVLSMRYFADTFADTQSALPSGSDGWTDWVSANILPLTESRGGVTIYLLYFILCEAKNRHHHSFI